MRSVFLALTALVPMSAFSASGPSIADFASDPSLDHVKISPNGDYIAGRVHFSSGPGIAVIRLADRKITASITLGSDQDLYDLWWVGPQRVVIQPSLYYETGDVSGSTGELIGMDADGDNQTYLFGYKGSDTVGSHIKKVEKTRGSASVIDPLLGDPKHAIIAVNDWHSGRDTQVTTTYKINVEDGLLSDEVAAPTTGYTRFLTDNNGIVRYAAVEDADGRIKTFVRNAGDKDWHPVNTGQLENSRVFPAGFSRDNSKVFLLSDEGGDRLCLVEQNLANGERRKISCDPYADVAGVVESFDGKDMIGLVFADAKRRVEYFDPEDPDSVLLRRLQVSFPDSAVSFVSGTADGSRIVIKVWSDRDPGTYYLVDTKTAKAELIAARFDPIYPDEMAERRPISFKARDGQQLSGYLTIPKGQELKSLPLVVHPHGGPIDIADTWAWDRESQMLANRGYAVLQVNFRGSSGFGKTFMDAGRKHWDGVMIDDITDGARWAVSQGYADPKRLCIYGASYGGYAALESAVREPDLYRCAIGLSGVYDLNLFKRDTDITRSMTGQEEFSQLIGDSTPQLQQASPISHLDQLKAAVFIAHGGMDQRTPISQAEALMKALDAKHYPYEKLIKPAEEHGFSNPKNREEFYTRMIAFLDRNIGSVAVPPPPANAATSAASAPTP